MKKAKVLVATMVCLLVLSVSGTAKAVVLAPGGSVVPTGAGPSPSVFVTTTGDLFFANGFYSGKVKQDVYLNATGYLFVYRADNFAVSSDYITRMTTTDFTGFTTDVDAFVPGDIPDSITRNPSGSTVGFQFNGGGAGDFGLSPGSTSATMWIQTSAKYYGPGTVTFQNGAVEAISAYGPAIPEPASMLLMGAGVLGMFSLRRKTVFA